MGDEDGFIRKSDFEGFGVCFDIELRMYVSLILEEGRSRDDSIRETG